MEERERQVRTARREGCLGCAVRDRLEGEKSLREPDWEMWPPSRCERIALGMSSLLPAPLTSGGRGNSLPLTFLGALGLGTGSALVHAFLWLFQLPL